MLSGNDSLFVNDVLIEQNRQRQFYLSLDVDLTKIETKSNTLKTIFSIFNAIKIPFPTLELNSKSGVKFRPVYF
ncbi:hypothetical protein [Lacinutrix sp.]|uniref:hypothetical protein n=1 Tax=Lacinutrix sp. TaxID=1937692 RepID=UPI0030EEA0F8